MSYIFQPDRYLLTQQIKRAAVYVKGRVLDVGAGEVNRYGNLFSYETYTRMDINHAPHVDVVGSVEAIPLPDESVDSVVCTQVFEHLKDPFAAVKEISRVLAPGGTLLLTVPQMNELHEEPHDFFRYTKYGLRHMFESSGFIVVHEDQRGGFFSTRAQMWIRYLIDRLGLYTHPLLRRIFSLPIKIYGRGAIFLDSLDKSTANRKHAIGWCFVFKKGN